MGARVDKADVIAALTAERVLEHFGVDYRRFGAELRFQLCPTCGPRTRADAVSASHETGRWIDHAHGCKGDLLAMVAGFLGVDIVARFDQVLAAAAELAGVSPLESDEERRQWRAELEHKRAERERSQAAARATAQARAHRTALDIWARLYRSSELGLAYLARRGVALMATTGDVRFGKRSVCVALRDSDGVMTNVVARLFVEGQVPKVRGLAGCSTMGCFGHLGNVAITTGPIVLVEGVFDFLSARVYWPGRLVAGAHGAGRLPDVAAMIAPLAALHQRGLLFVPHKDETGARYVDRAIAAAVDAGVLLEDIEVFLVGGQHKDLNDLLCARASL